MKLIKEVNPARILIFGYLVIIAIGALLLAMPFATKNSITIVDSIFTATSALCVTGLIVKDTAVDFTVWGKLIILFLIQIGGLGYMTLSTTFFYFLGRKISLRERIIFKESTNLLTYDSLMRFAWRILRITVFVELIGILLLYICFVKKFSPLIALGHAVFHSVSAFCNAGFSTFSENLKLFGDTISVPLITAFLIITGGIGFIVISDIYYVLVRREKKELSLHTKIVLRTTFILITLGTLIILFYEGQKSLFTLPFIQKIVHSFFQAITPRTAGFNTINISIFSPATLGLLLLFMFIGASPGGTGGGVKTSTFSLLVVWIKELLWGRYNNGITIMKKRIPEEQAKKAFLLVSLSFSLIVSAFIIIMVIDNPVPRKLLFEVFAAFGTVGLSLGSDINQVCSYSFDLSWIGKIIIIFLMLMGRVGTLTLSHALIKTRLREFTYPEESIVIG